MGKYQLIPVKAFLCHNFGLPYRFNVECLISIEQVCRQCARLAGFPGGVPVCRGAGVPVCRGAGLGRRCLGAPLVGQPPPWKVVPPPKVVSQESYGHPGLITRGSIVPNGTNFLLASLPLYRMNGPQARLALCGSAEHAPNISHRHPAAVSRISSPDQ